MAKKTRKKQRAVEEPYWAPLPRQAFSKTQVMIILARNLLPLACLLLLNGSALDFLLLTVFNLAFTIACIGTVGVAVSSEIEDANAGMLNAVSAWISLVLIGLFISLLLTAMFGWVIAVFASFTKAGVFNRTLLLSAIGILACALPDVYRQYQADRRSGLSEIQRKQRDQPIVLTHVLSAGLIFIMSGELLNMGKSGQAAMAIAVTALFVFRDLRPDLMRELTRPSNRPP